jgi:hypothetical protein
MSLVSYTILSRLCFATPTAGSRILETGTEQLLTLKKNGYLGDGMGPVRLFLGVHLAFYSTDYHRMDKV